MKQWTNLQGISTIPTETIKRFTGAKAVEKNIYCSADSHAEVIYYKIKHLGHALLVDPGKCFNQGGHRSLFSADKNYFSTWWTAIDFGLVSISTIHGEKQVKKNEQQLTYFITPSNPNSTFEWQLPKGCKILQNKGSSVTINWGTKPGNINVTEVIDNKCKQKYPTIYVRLSN